MKRIFVLLLAASAAACDMNLGLEEEEDEVPQRIIRVPNIQLNCVPHGGGSFGKHCTGYVDVSADPAFPTNYRIGAVLNAMSITGETRTTGSTVTRIPLEGDAIGCPFTQPSNVAIHDDTHLYPNALAVVQITWTTGTLCTQW